MPQNFQYDVFLSHNHADKPRVRRLAERLKTAGVRVWFDEWNVQDGDIIPLKVGEGLEQSRVLLLCISSAALASGWVALERSTAVHRDPANSERRFIPLLLDDCELPDMLRCYKYVDFRVEADAVVARLVATCRESVQIAASVTAAPPEAIRLDSKGPLSEAAEEILKAREDAGQFKEPALHVIRKPNPADPRQTLFFVDEATAPGSRSLLAMKSRVLQPAIDELRRNGFLEEPFTGPGTLVYEFLQ